MQDSIEDDESKKWGDIEDVEDDEQEEDFEDTYQLYTRDLTQPESTIQSQNNSLVKNYTDDKAILAEQLVSQSFDEHYRKFKLGEPDNPSATLDKIMLKIDGRAGSISRQSAALPGDNFSQISKANSLQILEKKPTQLQRAGTHLRMAARHNTWKRQSTDEQRGTDLETEDYDSDVEE